MRHLVLSFVLATGRGSVVPYGKPVREAFFQFEPGAVYFNHGGFGATPRPVQEAMYGYTVQMEEQPTKWFGTYHQYLQKNRPLLASIINASPDDLVYLDNASAGMNAVLRSLRWQVGDIVLLIGSLYAVFPNVVARLQKQYGVRALVVKIDYPVSGDADYLEAVRKTMSDLSQEERACVRIALVDHYSSYPSVLLPTAKIASLVKAETQGQSMVFVDGAHALGHVAVDLRELHAAGVDFYVMDGHKWFMSPHGSALLWAAPAAQGLLQPDVISSENGLGTPYQEAFDYIGTRDYGPWCAMGDAVAFRANELGGEVRIREYLHELAVHAHELFARRWGTEAAAPANMTGGLLTVGLPIPSEWSADAQAQCAGFIGSALRDTYKMQIIPFTLTMRGQVTHVARISAQVYLSRGDFDDLAENTLLVAKQCNASMVVI